MQENTYYYNLNLKSFFSFLFVINYMFMASQRIANIPKENEIFNNSAEAILQNKEKFSSKIIIFKGDSLYKSSINDWQKIKSSFVIIQGYKMQNDWDNALKIAFKADSIAMKGDVKTFKPTTNEIIADIYYNLNLYDKSLEYLNLSSQFNKNINRKEALINDSFIYQRISFIYQKQKKYKKALEANLQALKYINIAKKEYPSGDYSKVQIPVLLNTGVIYHNLKDYNTAKIYYRKSFNIINNQQHYFYLSYFYSRYASAELKLNNTDSAYFYIQKAKNLSHKLQDRNLELEINVLLNDYYSERNDFKRADSVKSIILNLTKIINNSEQKATHNIIAKEENKAKEQKEISYRLIIISTLLVILVFSVMAFKSYQSKQIKIKFEKIIKDLQNTEIPRDKENISANLNKGIKKEEKIFIPEKTIAELVAKLEKFEKGSEFTTKNFTISDMASLFNTNIKYMRYVLQKFRGKNFNDYINTLRINYITKKIISDPKLQNYKIDYLAEIAGYSSHSRFSQIFKKELKLSPSEFITQLSKINN